MQLHSALKEFNILMKPEMQLQKNMITQGSQSSHKLDALHTCTCELPRVVFQCAGGSHKKKKIFRHLCLCFIFVSKVISSAHFPERFLNWFWITADCWHVSVELKSLVQHLLQGCDLLHGIAVKSQNSSFSYCPVLFFSLRISWLLGQSIPNFCDTPVSQTGSHCSLCLPSLMPSLLVSDVKPIKRTLCKCYTLDFSGCSRSNSISTPGLVRENPLLVLWSPEDVIQAPLLLFSPVDRVIALAGKGFSLQKKIFSLLGCFLR